MRELVLGGRGSELRLRGHLWGRLGVVKGRIRHVGIAVLRRRGLRRVGLGRSEVGAGAADVAYSRVGSRQVVRGLGRGAALLERAVANGRRHGGRAVADVLELRVLHVMGHHGVLGRRVRVWGEAAFFVAIVVVVAILLAHEVLGALVLVCAAILGDLSVPCRFSAALDLGNTWMHTYW